MEYLHHLTVLCSSCLKGHIVLSNYVSADLICPVCQFRYPITNRILDMIPSSPSPKKIIQSLMESKYLVQVYDSLFWRHSPFTMALLQITSEREFGTFYHALTFSRQQRVILDIACGTGIYTRKLAQKMTASTVFGLDISMHMLNYASAKIQENGLANVNLIRCDAKTLPFNEEYFDGVICSGALHLFSDPQQVLMQIHRVLKVRGRFVFATFYKPSGFFFNYLARFSTKFLGLTPFGIETLKRLLKNSNFTDMKIHHKKGLWIIASVMKT